MGGGLMQLIAYGSQDACFVGPFRLQITQFKKISFNTKQNTDIFDSNDEYYLLNEIFSEDDLMKDYDDDNYEDFYIEIEI